MQGRIKEGEAERGPLLLSGLEPSPSQNCMGRLSSAKANFKTITFLP